MEFQEMARTRTERASMGTMTVPAKVLYGASTQRAVLNFPISGRSVGHEVIHAFALDYGRRYRLRNRLVLCK